MKLKYWNGLIFAFALFVCLSWGMINNKSLATIPSTQTTIRHQLIPSRIDLIAQANSGEFIQPPLPYSYQALEPYIDAQTMEIHYTKHHRGYVNNLNVAIAKHPELKGQSLEELIENFEIIPDDIKTSVRNNGGGHFNHLIFWSIMSPNGGGEPTGEIAKAIQKNFGDFEQFKTKFKEAGSKQFGSGWVWLMMTQEGKLEITNSPGQDSPIMQGNYPILGSDVWEHAYYLKYKSSRGDYLDAWWNVVNWDEVNKRFEEAKSIM